MKPEDQRDAIEQIRNSLAGVPPQVLIVEDNADDASLTRRVLESQGATAVSASTIEEAKELLDSSEHYRLAFLDLKLGEGRSGSELLKYFRESSPSTWVVVLSGVYTEDSYECKEALKNGACAVMLKPLTVDKVKLIFGTP